MTLPILILQVTLWLLLGTCLYLWCLRQGPRAAARCLSLVLGGVVLLSVIAMLPLPGWPVDSALTWMESEAKHVPRHQATVRIEHGPIPEGERSALSFNLASLFSRLQPRAVAEEPAPDASASSWGKNVILALLLGCGLFGMIRLLLGLWAVRECRRRSVPITDTALLDMCNTLQEAMGLAPQIELRALPGLGSPATIGWRKPLVLLPENWPAWSEEERRSVLAHELAHVQAGDYGRWLLAQCGAVLHGYQPLVHWLLARLHREQELAADLVAARHAGGTGIYLRSLCRLALAQTDGTHPFPARTFLPVRFSLIRRITMLRSWKNDEGQPTSRFRRFSGLALLLLLGVGVAGLRSAGWAQEKGEETNATTAAAIAPKTDIAPFAMEYLRKETLGVVAVRPSVAFQFADMKPWQAQANALVQETLKELLGKEAPNLGLEQIEQIILEMNLTPKTAEHMGNVGASLNLIRLTAGQSCQPLLKPILPKLEAVAHGQGSYYRLPAHTFSISPPTSEGEPGCIYMPDERTLVFASEAEVRRWLTGGKPTMPDLRWKQEWQAADASAPFLAVAVDGPRFRQAMGLVPLDDPRLAMWVKVLEQAPSLVFYFTQEKHLTVNLIAAGEKVNGSTLGRAILAYAQHLLPFVAPLAAKGKDNRELGYVVDPQKQTLRLQMKSKADSARTAPQPLKEVVPAGAGAVSHNVTDSFRRLTFQHETSVTLGLLVGSVLGGHMEEAAAPAQPDHVFQAQVRLVEVPRAIVEKFGEKHFANKWAERKPGAILLSAAQTRELLEAAQADMRTTVLCAPIVQALPGQNARIAIGPQKEDPAWECKVQMTDPHEGKGIVLDLHHRYNDDGKGLRPETPLTAEKPKHQRVLAWSHGAREVIPPGHSMMLLATGPDEKPQPGETTFLLLATPSREPLKK